MLNKEQFKQLINVQMILNGYHERFEDLKGIEGWYHKFTTTEFKEKIYIGYLKWKLKKL